MKIIKALTLIMAAAALLAFTLPANAQSNRHGGGNSNRGNGRHGDFHFHHGGNRVNFFFGGAFGYPFYGYPFYGYPYYGYPYAMAMVIPWALPMPMTRAASIRVE